MWKLSFVGVYIGPQKILSVKPAFNGFALGQQGKKTKNKCKNKQPKVTNKLNPQKNYHHQNKTRPCLCFQQELLTYSCCRPALAHKENLFFIHLIFTIGRTAPSKYIIKKILFRINEPGLREDGNKKRKQGIEIMIWDLHKYFHFFNAMPYGQIYITQWFQELELQ